MAGKIDLAIAPIDCWPRDDRLAWQAAVSDAGFFGDSGKLAHHNAQRLKALASAYGRWISFLDAYAPSHTGGLDWCDDRAAVSGFLDRLGPLAPCSVRAYLTDLFTACQALAPERDFALLHTVMRHQWRTARPVSDKRTKIVPARDLYELGIGLMAQAPTCSTPLRQATQYRDGLMIAMLITCPVRIGNFLAIELERHLVFDGGHYRLRFEGSEVKNRRALAYLIPSALAPCIDRWLNDYRPICLVQRGRHYGDDGGRAFWVTSGGGRYRNTGHVRSRIAGDIAALRPCDQPSPVSGYRRDHHRQ